MTELELYKYITENKIEYHWFKKDGEKDVWLCIPFNELEEFRDLLTLGLFDDEGLEVHMKDYYVVVTMNYICDYYDIEITNVFGEPKE